METVNIYYTPEISEFHIGFECEYRWKPESRLCFNCKGDLLTKEGLDPDCTHSGSYTNLEAYDWRTIVIDASWFNDDLINNIFNNELEFRVKILDSQDVIELSKNIMTPEEIDDKHSTYVRGQSKVLNIKGETFQIIIYYEPVTSTMAVSIGFYSVSFKGIIRNKSEFGRLMKQLQLT